MIELMVEQKSFFENDKLIDNLKNYLLGSGYVCVNFYWQINGKLCLEFSYHNMDGNGHYDGYTYFTIKIPVVNDWVLFTEFDIVCNGSYRKYSDESNKDFYGDNISYYLTTFFTDHFFNYNSGEVFKIEEKINGKVTKYKQVKY